MTETSWEQQRHMSITPYLREVPRAWDITTKLACDLASTVFPLEPGLLQLGNYESWPPREENVLQENEWAARWWGMETKRLGTGGNFADSIYDSQLTVQLSHMQLRPGFPCTCRLAKARKQREQAHRALWRLDPHSERAGLLSEARAGLPLPSAHLFLCLSCSLGLSLPRQFSEEEGGLLAQCLLSLVFD